MQLPTWLVQIIKSGEVTLYTGGVEALQIKAEGNRVNLNIVDEKFLKNVVESMGSKTSLRRKLAQIASIAEELKEQGLTYILYYKGKRLLTIGSEAKPKLSSMVTRTNAVEINNLRKLLELAV